MGNLIKNNQVASPDTYYQDTFFTKPSTTRSVFDNFASSFLSPFVGMQELTDSQFAQRPEGQGINNFLELVKAENTSPGMGLFQRSANEVSGLIGSSLNPLTWMAAAAGGTGVKAALGGLEKIAPSAVTSFFKKPLVNLLGEKIGKYIPTLTSKDETLSVALLGNKATTTFGTFAGAVLPQSLSENYNLNTNHIEWGGVAREMGETGAFGLAIGSIPFAWGVLRGKINRAHGEAPNTDVGPDKVDSAIQSGIITPAEGAWLKDWDAHQKNPADIEKMQELQQRANEIVSSNGAPVNSVSHEVPVELLTQQDLHSLQAAAADQLVSDLPDHYKTTLSDFIANNRLDEIRQNPKLLDGLRGYADFVGRKLENKSERLSEADQMVDKHLLRSVKENMSLSQKDIFKLMKKMQFEDSHLSHLPFTVPENLVKHAKIMQKIGQRKSKQKLYEGALEKEPHRTEELTKKIKINSEKMDQLEKEVPQVLIPKEELQHLRAKLLTPKGLKKNWERSTAYHRLSDLAQIWGNAKTLLDRVHLEHQYEKQTAFKSLVDNVLKVSDDNIGKSARPENVANYLKARVEGKIYQKASNKEAKDYLEDTIEIPKDADTLLDEQAQTIEKSSATELAQEFNASADKYKEFKSSSNIFKDLIDCVLGAANG